MEERKQFDQMLEGKQLELSKHLKELSQRNDQVLNKHYNVILPPLCPDQKFSLGVNTGNQ